MTDIGPPDKYLDAHKRGLVTKFQLINYLYVSVLSSSPDDIIDLCTNGIRVDLIDRVRNMKNINPNDLIHVESYCGSERTESDRRALERESLDGFVAAQEIWNSWIDENGGVKFLDERR